MPLIKRLAVALVLGGLACCVVRRGCGPAASTLNDALFQIPEVAGRIVLVRDADGDGIGDLMIERGVQRGFSDRIDLVSSRSGTTIRTLWRESDSQPMADVWTSGGDVDGDGVSDLLLGFPGFNDETGRVVIVSGRTGEVILKFSGTHAHDRLGSDLAFLGDVDGDGRDDFAVSAVQYDSSFSDWFAQPVASWKSVHDEHGNHDCAVFADGSRIDVRANWQARMRLRSISPGYVAARSGGDGREIWRVNGEIRGHGFGTSMRAIADFDYDHKMDVLVQSDLKSDEPYWVLSGATGRKIARFEHGSGPAGTVGDVDGDGVPDFFFDQQDEHFIGRCHAVQIVSGTSRKKLLELPYPDFWDEYEVTVPLGDIDGDGVPDIALGGPNFNLPGMMEGRGYCPWFDPYLGRMSLDQALFVESRPWCSFTWESGAAVVYSGRTHHAIFGVWAPPGSRKGLGLEVTALPDINGDGCPDIIVSDEDTAYVFAGPGPAKKK
jgi:hypothetical protein